MPSEWYFNLKKPRWTPPPKVIGIIWTILYPIIAVSFLFVVWKVYLGAIAREVLVAFLMNLIANLLFTPIMFRLKNLPLAAMDIAIVWASTVWVIVLAWPFTEAVSYALLPYLLWVSIAMVLQFSITWMNR